MINVNEKGFVSARELHKVLEVKTRFDVWMPRMFEYGFIENRDYNKVTSKNGLNSKGGRSSLIEYLLTKDTAKEIAMIQRSPKGKQIREYLLGLDDKREQGLLYSGTEVINLLDMVMASQFAEFRDKARKNHLSAYIPHEPKNKDFASAQLERNNVCGIDKIELEKRLNTQNIKYVSVEKCLIKIDKFELIRISVIDCMIHFGKSKEYAVNIGNFAKDLAKQRTDLSFTRINKMFTVPDSIIKTMDLLNN